MLYIIALASIIRRLIINMKSEKGYLKAFTLTALILLVTLSALSTLPIITSAGEFAPPPGWLSYNAVTFNNTAAIARVNEPVDVFFGPPYLSTGNLTSTDEIRVIAPDNVTQVPYQTYNITWDSPSENYIVSLNIVFRVNVPASSTATYHIVYNNPGVSAPSYTTDLKLKAVPQGGVNLITARVSNAKYSAYVGIEGSIGGTETGKEVYIKDWTGHENENIFSPASGGIWSFPAVKFGTTLVTWGTYNPAMTLVRNGSVFADLNAPAEFLSYYQTTAGLLNFTSNLRFYAHNSWFTNTLTFYTTGAKSYKFLKLNTATDQVNLAYAVYRNSTGGLVVHNVNIGGGHPDTFTTNWDGTWVDYANSSAADNDHGFFMLQLPGGTPYIGLMCAAFSCGHATGAGDTWDFYWNGTGALFTSNMVCGFHANSNYTYVEDLYAKLNNSLQSTLEVLAENGAPAPTGGADRTGAGWSTYTPINVTETIGKARTFEPVDVFFKPSAGTLKNINEIRVYDSAGNEIPSQVYNQTQTGPSFSSLNVVFEANVTANTEKTYYIWYNKTGASAPSYPTDLQITTTVTKSIPGYYSVDAANTYYNSTGDITGTGAMTNVKVLSYSSTLNIMGSIFAPQVHLPNMPEGEGYFGFFPGANSTILRSGPVFADVLTNVTVTNFGLAQGYRTSGLNWTTIRLRYYAYTPWVTANITYNANGTVNYELMEIGVKVASISTVTDAEGVPWLTRPNAASTPQTYNMSLKPGNVTTDSDPQTLSWCADWDQSWACFRNSTVGNSPVGAALVNLNDTTTTDFVGLKSETGDEGSPYWNGTCTTKTTKLAIGFFTNDDDTYAQNLYNKLSKKPLTWVIGEEKAPPFLLDRTVTYVNRTTVPSKYSAENLFVEAPESYPTWGVPYKFRVTVKNLGTTADDFSVTAYYGNATGNYTIGTQNVVGLAPGASTTLIFSFAVPPLPGHPDNAPAAWPYPAYTIYGIAESTGDMNTTNNELSGGTIMVKWPGDATGDGHVILADLVKLAKAWYGDAKTNPSKYNYIADFDMNGEIKLADLVKLAKNWYKGPLD